MRIYLPLTLPALAEHVTAGVFPADLERFTAVDESEEAEYDALCAAAEDAVGLLAGAGRRVVLVAEVTDADGPALLTDVVAVHADTEDVDPDQRDLPELGWFATQEISGLVGGVAER